MTIVPDVRSPAPPQLPNRPPEECRVLIVDDDERVVEILQTILGMDGYQILAAYDGASALRTIEQDHPDVVILDVILPDLDGIAVCQQIKQTQQTQFLPVVLVTGAGMRDRRLDGRRVGADDFLEKPIDTLELSARVRSLMRQRQLYLEVEANQTELQRRVDERTQELQAANRRLEELSKVKGNVLRIVSHELRTPLHQAKLALGVARQDGLSSEARNEALDLIEKRLGMLEHLSDEATAFSDAADLKRVPVAVPVLVAGAVARLGRFQQDGLAQVQSDVPRGLPATLVDPDRMVRVVAHLIDNAIKFGEGKPVTVSAAPVEDGVRLTIRDEGMGVTDEVRPKLFLPLEQGDDSSTRRHGGIGIGLALVKMVLDAHGITLDFDSAPGMGTTVSFVLPLAEFEQ
jgi:signal transduction histidine kinase